MKVEMEMETEGEDSYEKHSMESSSSSYDVSLSPRRPSSLSELVSSCHSSSSSDSSPASDTSMFSTSLPHAMNPLIHICMCTQVHLLFDNFYI